MVFAAAPAGPLPPEQVTVVEAEYILYREKYNRCLDYNWCFIGP
jgi:hypothetical protein